MAVSVTAQTYNNGVWYALYDDDEHTMNTQGDYETGAVFAPTTGTLNVQWRYEWIDWLGFARKIDTDVLESSDGGSDTRQIGSFQENTNNSSNTTETFAVSENINWIKYNRSGLPTHKVIVYHQDIPLAKHILLDADTYGATTGSVSFDPQDMLTVSSAKRVQLRSFLTAGNISVTCSQPEIFRIGSEENTSGLTYAVGANACASKNGTANKAGGSALGKIDNYGLDIFFAPQEDKTYEALITITDGTSTATVTVRGTGLYVEPPTPPAPPEDTYFAYSAAICDGDTYSDDLFTGLTLPGDYIDTIPNFEGADSIITFTLTVNPLYAFEDSLTMYVGDNQSWQGLDLSLLPVGDTALSVSYAARTTCDSTYTLYLTVQPRITTYGNDTIELCYGDMAAYEGKTYRRSTVDSVLLGQTNRFGGDSIVELVVIVYPEVSITASVTITEGEPQTWQDFDLSTMPVGDTTLVATYASVHGCDSTFVLHLTVEEFISTEDLPFTLHTDTSVRKVIRNGAVYIRKGDEWFDLLGRKRQD